MPDSYTSSLKLTLPADGDTNWGALVNNGITNLVDASVAGTTTVAFTTSADYTLTTSNGATDEARKMFLNFTGTPGAAANVICPAVSKLYFVSNNTTGGFSITVKTAAGTGIAVGAGISVALYCNGTNIVSASTAGISVPISISQGGTSSTTASGARINLGGTSTGIALFTAATQAAAYAALGVAPSGVVNGGTY
jgi:hypothetical protein